MVFYSVIQYSVLYQLLYLFFKHPSLYVIQQAIIQPIIAESQASKETAGSALQHVPGDSVDYRCKPWKDESAIVAVKQNHNVITMWFGNDTPVRFYTLLLTCIRRLYFYWEGSVNNKMVWASEM